MGVGVLAVITNKFVTFAGTPSMNWYMNHITLASAVVIVHTTEGLILLVEFIKNEHTSLVLWSVADFSFVFEEVIAYSYSSSIRTWPIGTETKDDWFMYSTLN